MLEKSAKRLDVENFTGRTGRLVPNQFIITDGQTKAFKSYNSIIVEQRGAGGGFDNDNEKITKIVLLFEGFETINIIVD